MPKSNRISTLTALFLLLVDLTGCQSELSRTQPEQFDNPEFSIKASNLLFFRNVRSYYYQQVHDTLQPLEVYRWHNYTHKPNAPQIQPLLVINTLQDQATMLVELRLPHGRKVQNFCLILTSVSGRDTLLCQTTDAPKIHHQLLTRLYRAIENKVQIDYLAKNQKLLTLFSTKKEQSEFMIQVRDYLRLTGAYD